MLVGPSEEYLSAIYTIRKLYKPDNLELKGGEELILNRRIAVLIAKLRGENPELDLLIKDVMDYNQTLQRLDLKDEEINDLKRRFSLDIGPIMTSFGIFLFCSLYV